MGWRRFRARPLLAGLVGVLCSIGAASPHAAFAGPESTHSGIHRTKRFEIRFRPGSRAAADVDRQAVVAERDLDRIAKALDASPKGPYQLWLYDDVWELGQATGTVGNGGFSSGNASHVPYDNDQTRFHELLRPTGWLAATGSGVSAGTGRRSWAKYGARSGNS